VIELNAGNFVSTVSQKGIVLVDCWAKWCGGCKTFSPLFAKVAAKHPEHTFGKLDTEAEKEITKKLEIKHIPTLLLYRDGLMLFHQPGNFDEKTLEGIITQAESLDMDQVRAEIAREQAQEFEKEAIQD
jgi:thioredoxin 1